MSESEGELDLQEKIFIASQIVQGMEFLHETHGASSNISNELIFLDDSLEIVKLMPIDKNLQDSIKGRLYLNAEIYLKMMEEAFIQPEFLEIEKDFFDRRPENDIWSLGLVLYEMFAKNEGLDKEKEEIIKIKDRKKKVLLYSNWVEKIEVETNFQSAGEIKKIIQKCLKVKKEERLSANEILESLGNPLI